MTIRSLNEIGRRDPADVGKLDRGGKGQRLRFVAKNCDER